MNRHRAYQTLATLAFALLVVTAACSPVSTGGSSGGGSSSPTSSGGGSAASTGPKTIGVVSLAAANGGSARMIAAIKEENNKLGWKTNVVDTAGDPAKVPPTIQSFISAHLSGIVVDVLDPTAYAGQAAAAKSAGIPIISVNSVEFNPNITTQIGEDPFALGANQGRYFVDRLSGHGNIGILTYSDATNLRFREQTFGAVLRQYPGIHIVGRHEVNVVNAVSDAKAVMDSWLNQFGAGQLDAVWAGWDEPALGASSSIDAASRKDVWVEGADFDPAVGQRMAQGGSYQAEWFVDYVQQGQETVMAFQKIFAGKKVPAHIWLPIQLITQQNLPPAGQFPKAQPVYSTT